MRPPPHNFLELAKARKTTYEFNSKKVKDSSIQKILEAGRWAPSCTNSQPWHFIVVKDENTIRKLMKSAYYGDFHTDPPLIVAVVLLKESCPGKGFSCFRSVASGVHDSFVCIGMAGSNMVLEAESLGIDSCILTPTQATAKNILKVNARDAIPIIIGLGHQSKMAFQKKRQRKELSEIASCEYFGGKC